MATDHKAIVRHDVAEVWDRGNVEAIGERYAEEFVFHYPGQSAMDREAFAGFVSGFRAAVPDLATARRAVP